jgi:beta-lactamase regulating signal transducer with metallopeptidase domain
MGPLLGSVNLNNEASIIASVETNPITQIVGILGFVIGIVVWIVFVVVRNRQLDDVGAFHSTKKKYDNNIM